MRAECNPHHRRRQRIGPPIVGALISLSLSTYLLLIFLVSKYLLLYPSTLKLKWLRPEGLVMIDCFRGAQQRGAGLSEPGRQGAGPRAYWRGSRHRGARRICRMAAINAARGAD